MREAFFVLCDRFWQLCSKPYKMHEWAFLQSSNLHDLGECDA